MNAYMSNTSIGCVFGGWDELARGKIFRDGIVRDNLLMEILFGLMEDIYLRIDNSVQ